MVDAATGDLVSVVSEDPIYDVDNVMKDPDTYEIQAVVYQKDRVHWEVLDSSLEPHFENLRALDQGDLFVTSRSSTDRIWLVGYVKSDGPVAYYAYDVDAAEGSFLFYHRPALREYTLAEMHPVTYEARDGLTIHGYITYPPGEERRNLPLVLLVHGGPWARDTWGYNPEVQWLANRGYAVLQVNFRGSRGYGKAHLNAGDREWAGKMHDDLIDAVNWAVGEGIADPDRIAIYGFSYGGYAALVGAAFTPDVFCCAIDVSGPSNLLTLLGSIPPYWTAMREVFYTRVGNPETEKNFLRSRSPLFQADRIRIPMLIVQGANDPRVKQAEADQIVEALRESDIDYEYLLFDDEGHGLTRPENRMRFYATAEKFLARHLGGRYQKD
jgi:dipeptidyl aminopeptidase/acylaminoacyl peptidase